MHGAVQRDRVSAVETAGYCKGRSTGVSGAVQWRRCTRLHRRSDQRHQIVYLAAHERHFQDAGVLDNRTDARRTRLDHRGIGLNLDGLGHLTHFQDDLDRRIAVDLQHDPSLRECSKSRQSRLQPVRTHWQVRQNV